jgi:predicted DNA binding CopG/RHH family protein
VSSGKDQLSGLFLHEELPKLSQLTMEGKYMKEEYNFSDMKSRKNPYVKKLKKQITIRLAVETIDYFKRLSEESGLPYQNLIDLYLEDCARNHKKMEVRWN